MTKEEIETKVTEAKKLVTVGSKWVHYKNPDAAHAYEVTGLSLLVTGEEVILVQYQPLYDDVAQVTFSRTLEEWFETVDVSGTAVRRFQLLERQT